MAINKTIALTWKGEKYPLLITMGIIDQIEDQINLMRMVQQVAAGDLRFSHAAKLIAILLETAGAEDVTQEAVYEGMFGAGDADLNPIQVVEMVSAILDVIFPKPKKKSTTTKRKKANSSKGIRGKTSTK